MEKTVMDIIENCAIISEKHNQTGDYYLLNFVEFKKDDEKTIKMLMKALKKDLEDSNPNRIFPQYHEMLIKMARCDITDKNNTFILVRNEEEQYDRLCLRLRLGMKIEITNMAIRDEHMI